MEIWEIVLLVIGIYFLVVLIYSLVIYFLVQKEISFRADKNPLLHYYTADDYPALKTEPLRFKNDKGETLNGKVYYTDNLDSDRVCLFFHGFGAGHEAYTTLINDLVTTLGMPLLAFDYTGCDLSEGKKIPNTLQALSDADHFLAYLATHEKFKHKKLILCGHSWGGFVASNLYPYNKDKNIIKVISINGVTDFGLVYKNTAHAPYLFLVVNNIINAFRYKKLAFATTRKSIKNTPVPHLFMHGLKDPIIAFSPYISSLVLQEDKYKSINFHFEKERYHNAYLTNDSEAGLQTLQREMKAYGNAKESEKEAIAERIKAIDFSKLVENDKAFLTVIKKFVEEPAHEKQ